MPTQFSPEDEESGGKNLSYLVDMDTVVEFTGWHSFANIAEFDLLGLTKEACGHVDTL